MYTLLQIFGWCHRSHSVAALAVGANADASRVAELAAKSVALVILAAAGRLLHLCRVGHIWKQQMNQYNLI